jgi:hypothetical protein
VSPERAWPPGEGADATVRRQAEPPQGYTEPPIIREGVYVKPLPLRARHLGPESWWLRDQWWAEIHLARLAGAWERVYGKRAA